ncbi:hypothetical protein DRE_03230 [Drechslerella stenobrocha 248]|uniref:PSP1 C-terminal domain-containing protein n=1 Tax=Drechslerella stenobrocha 248 TaxID=1043628 RepID=W7IEZ7_9PEZI|nr:hypothetical protein DRE_03230 [Drechslerella stenobrocha 248]
MNRLSVFSGHLPDLTRQQHNDYLQEVVARQPLEKTFLPHNNNTLFSQRGLNPLPIVTSSNSSDDRMSESQSTNTPRLSEVSSVDSPKDLPDPVAPAQVAKAANARMPGVKPPFHSGAFSGSLDPMAYVSEEMYRKTPESEALASSDEEQDQAASYFPPGLKNPKLESISTMSSRRPSYAAEFSNRNRNLDAQNGHDALLSESNPSSPLADLSGWPPSKGQQERKASINLTWSAGSIWNQGSARKNPTKGLVGSILTTNGPGSLYSNTDSLQSPTSLLPGSSSDLSIPIPPNPQPRNYRSMSFSVGQRELEEQARPRLSPPAHHTLSRLSGLHHRPSRPSLLSEEHYANGSPLRSVFEAPDQIEERMEESALENMMSAQAIYASHSRQYDSLRFRNRTMSGASSSARTITASTGRPVDPNNSERLEDFENALADDDDVDALAATGFFGHNRGFDSSNQGRRFSEAPRSTNFPENQRLELLKKQHWQNVGVPFGGEDDLGSQSRRHSFAGPLPKAGEEYSIAQSSPALESYPNISPTQPEGISFDNYLVREQHAQNQAFNSAIRSGFIPAEVPPLSVSPEQQRVNGPAGLYQPAFPLSQMAPRNNQLLYLVSFKACRADVFFVQEGTGLRVKNGDLVIVEADRGTDLGTVTGENVTWNQAKALKEEAAARHYEWLMMFSNRRPGGAAPPNSATGPTPTLVNGQNMGDPALNGQAPDPSATELKPKMIKRLAQVHEIQTLRDKEANEAKAKRVCQQKVIEHRLPMEILDAEFQMDWKKLTFYYYADTYINFNSLVTDLFKIYKTRIWMSAMNPASFAHANGGAITTRINTGPPILQGVISDHLSDVALQQHYGNIGIPSQYAYAPSIPRALVPPGTQQIYAQQQMAIPQPIALYPVRQATHGVVPHQDFSHLPQQQQNNGYYMNSQNGGTSPLGQGLEFRTS